MGGVVGIDVGGTFTDLYYVERRRHGTHHQGSSTPDDPSLGLLDALRAAEIDPADLDAHPARHDDRHQRGDRAPGARCALVTTRGFRDMLELGRRDRPHMYGLTGIQQPLIPRDRRWEVDERIDHQGNVLIAARRRRGARARRRC